LITHAIAMSGRVSEDGLSEVIGFILIIGVLVVVASLYMTYMVPAQGRETEIGHMDYIKQQFLDYKISTDALWINNQKDVTTSQAITLGTQGPATTGSFVGFQIFSPVASSGTIEVNPNEISDSMELKVKNPIFNSEVIERSGNPLDYQITPIYSNEEITETIRSLNFNEKPQKITVKFSTAKDTIINNPIAIPYNELISDQYYGSEFVIGDTKVLLKAIPHYNTKDYTWTSLSSPPSGLDDNYLIRFETDLVLTIINDNVLVLDNFVIKSKIDKNIDYYVDLMDPGYGLYQILPSSFDLTARKISDYDSEIFDSNSYDITISSDSSSYIKKGLDPNTYTFLLPPPDFLGPTSPLNPRIMGGIQFRSSNNYYKIEQQYLYQLGGLYVKQLDGSAVLNLPHISLKRDNDGSLEFFTIEITDIRINGESSLSGSNPVQISTSLVGIENSGLDISKPNVASVEISVQNSNQPELWRTIFKSLKSNAGIIDDDLCSISESPDTPILTIIGPEFSDDVQDIKLIVRYVDFNVELDSVGKSVGIS
jgi:hypothetical protein